jgi:NitT/TauT family transport system permease protein
MDLARSTGARGWRIFLKVRLPHALPTLFTGIKVAAALAATAAVVAEFVASDRGLGYKIQEYTNNFDTPMTFGAILVLCAMGLVLYGAVEVAERLAIPWHVSRRGAQGGSATT